MSSAHRFSSFAISLALCFGAAASAGAGEPLPDAGEVVAWLRRYVEIDTSNPPGNELEGARFLAAICQRFGIEHRLLTSPGGRTSLYARLPATVEAPAAGLVLSHHIDVVPAAAAAWAEPPFSGRLKDGLVWGRGTIDVKSLGIAQLVALLRVAADDAPRVRDLVYLAVADEEAGGGEGTGWILAAHGELLAGVAGVLGEGGVNRVIGEQVIWWGIEVSQKRPLWLRLTARGRGAHGSTPLLETATHTLVRGLARIVEPLPRLRVAPDARRFLDAIAAVEGESTGRLVRRLDAIIAEPGSPALPPSWLGVLYDSLQITRLEASDSVNVIAPVARAWLDIRLLPDTDQGAYLADLRQRLGQDIEVEILLDAPPAAASATDTALYRTLEAVLGVRGAALPAMVAGVTDSRYFRQRGIAAYGWNPFVLEGGAMRGVHAGDEALDADDFLRGVELVARVVRTFLAAGQPAG